MCHLYNPLHDIIDTGLSYKDLKHILKSFLDIKGYELEKIVLANYGILHLTVMKPSQE